MELTPQEVRSLKKINVSFDKFGLIHLFHATPIYNYCNILVDNIIKPPCETNAVGYYKYLTENKTGVKSQKIYLATFDEAHGQIVTELTDRFGYSSVVLEVAVNPDNLRIDEDSTEPNFFNSFYTYNRCSHYGRIYDFRLVDIVHPRGYLNSKDAKIGYSERKDIVKLFRCGEINALQRDAMLKEFNEIRVLKLQEQNVNNTLMLIELGDLPFGKWSREDLTLEEKV
jgi:hypothetical protein